MNLARMVKHGLVLLTLFGLNTTAQAQSLIGSGFSGNVVAFENPAYQAVGSRFEATFYGQSALQHIAHNNTILGVAATGRLSENGLGLGVVTSGGNTLNGMSIQTHINKAFKIGNSRYVAVGAGIINRSYKTRVGEKFNNTDYTFGGYYKGKRLEVGYNTHLNNIESVVNKQPGNRRVYSCLQLKYRFTFFKKLDITPSIISTKNIREQIGVQAMWKEKIYAGVYADGYQNFYNVGVKLHEKYDVCFTFTRLNTNNEFYDFNTIEVVLNYKL